MVADGAHRRSLKHTVVQDLIAKEEDRLYPGEQMENAKPPSEIALEERLPAMAKGRRWRDLALPEREVAPASLMDGLVGTGSVFREHLRKHS